MMRQIYEVLRQKNQVLKNFIFLGLVQATNFIIPIITFPYLIRIVGLEKFGIISYGLTIMMYYIVLTDYGFNLSATRLVVLYRNDIIKLSKLFSTVLATKLLLLLLSGIIMVTLCLCIPRFKDETFIYLFGMIYVFGSAIVPVWFFQGMDQMKYITYLNVIAKITLLVLLFTLIKSPQDYRYVIGLYGIANVISGLYSIRIAIRQYNLVLKMPVLNDFTKQLYEGWHIFTSSLAVVITNNITIIILGFFVSDISIGYYSISEKIIIVSWTILSLFSQAIYPSVCRMSQDSHDNLKRFIRRVCLPFIGMVAIGCLCIYLFAEDIIWYIVGDYKPESVKILRIMSVVPLVVALNIPAYQTMLAYNLKKQYSFIFNGSALLNLITCPLLIHYLGLLGAAISMVLVQSLLTLSLHLTLELRFNQFSLFRARVHPIN